MQVSDRWHLLGNLRDTLERLIVRHGPQLREARHEVAVVPQPNAAELPSQTAMPPALESEQPDDRPKRTAAEQSRVDANRARRLARYDEVKRLRAAGAGIRAISQHVDLDVRTVRLFVRAESFPQRAERAPVAGGIDAHRQHLRQRVADGVMNAMLLWHEVRAAGFRGRYRMVQRVVAALQPISSRSAASALGTARGTTPPVAIATTSPRRACAWVLGWDQRRSDAATLAARRSFVERLCAIEPAIAAARAIAQEFVPVVGRHDVDGFERWLAQTARCDVAELRRFAVGLHGDLDAVHAAVATDHSSGQVEGQVNRLKAIKRQMFGRAKLDLLQARLLAPG